MEKLFEPHIKLTHKDEDPDEDIDNQLADLFPPEEKEKKDDKNLHSET